MQQSRFQSNATSDQNYNEVGEPIQIREQHIFLQHRSNLSAQCVSLHAEQWRDCQQGASVLWVALLETWFQQSVIGIRECTKLIFK